MQFPVGRSSGHHEMVGEQVALNERFIATNISRSQMLTERLFVSIARPEHQTV